MCMAGNAGTISGFVMLKWDTRKSKSEYRRCTTHEDSEYNTVSINWRTWSTSSHEHVTFRLAAPLITQQLLLSWLIQWYLRKCCTIVVRRKYCSFQGTVIDMRRSEEAWLEMKILKSFWHSSIHTVYIQQGTQYITLSQMEMVNPLSFEGWYF